MANDVEILPPQPNKPWQFQPGESGRKDPARAKMRMHKFAKAKSFRAIQEVYNVMVAKDTTNPVKLAAAQIILDRAFGKPQQDIEVTNQGRTLEDMLREIWSESQLSGSDTKLIEPVEEPSE